MPLYKFCHAEHNPHRGSKVKLGTLYEYRSAEHPEIKDHEEGKFFFTIQFPEQIELDRRWANLLLHGAIGFGKTDDIPRFPGSYSVHVESLNLVTSTADSVTVANTSIRIDRQVPNCLIFCMSQMQSPDESPFSTYEDHWSIADAQADEFSRRLASLVIQQAKLSQFEGGITQKHTLASLPSLAITARHGPVRYQDRTMRITPTHRPSFEELVATLTDVAFFKPEEFAPDKEYRFVFELHDRDMIYPPINAPIFLEPNALKSL